MNDLESLYSPWLRRGTRGGSSEEGEQYPPRLRVGMNLVGPSWALTRISITPANGETVRGSGWPFLREHMGASRLRNAHVCLTVELSGVWCKSGQFGPRVCATEAIFFMPTAAADVAHEKERQKLDMLERRVVGGVP